MRFLQYLPELSKFGIDVKVQILFDDRALTSRYKQRRYSFSALLRAFYHRLAALRAATHFDLLWIEKEALPWWPQWAEAFFLRGVRYVLDYDDAVFHIYDHHRLPIICWIFGKRLDSLMRHAHLVVSGNDYLAQRSKDAGADWVEELPTVIDLVRYPWPQSPEEANRAHKPTIVWIGSPSTVSYLELLREPLQRLTQNHDFVFRVIGGEVSIPGVSVECFPWSEQAEVALIAAADVGVMPLMDTPWERGKCGYKLIQYMACGLPVVASPVGFNIRIVQPEVNGYLADGVCSWTNALDRLLVDSALRARMGAAGRQLIETSYCIQVTGSRLAELLRLAATKE